MRISDIDVIRGDTQTQKPFVAFGADTTLDPSEPYGEEPKTCTVRLTEKERDYIFSLLDQRRRAVSGSLKANTVNKTSRHKIMERLERIDAIKERFKGNRHGESEQPRQSS